VPSNGFSHGVPGQCLDTLKCPFNLRPRNHRHTNAFSPRCRDHRSIIESLVGHFTRFPHDKNVGLILIYKDRHPTEGVLDPGLPPYVRHSPIDRTAWTFEDDERKAARVGIEGQNEMV
jgi:hypothetical protein